MYLPILQIIACHLPEVSPDKVVNSFIKKVFKKGEKETVKKIKKKRKRGDKEGEQKKIRRIDFFIILLTKKKKILISFLYYLCNFLTISLDGDEKGYSFPPKLSPYKYITSDG